SIKINNQWHAAGIVRDITKRKQAETELRTLYKAVENASAYVIITDPQARIQYVNKKFTEITGYQRYEVIGKNPRILSSGEHTKSFYKQMWDTISKGGEWKGEFKNKRKNGELYYESALISSITDKQGNIIQYIGIKDDISKDKMAQQELINAKQAAEAANKTKTVFLANMSHEIRTPINAIIGFSEILSTNLTKQNNLAYIKSIQASSKTLLDLINDILDLSKIEAGQMSIYPEITNIKKLVEDIAQIFSLKIQQKGLRLDIYIDPAIPDYIIIDELRTRQTLLNIIGNAVKFTDKGYIRVSITKEKSLPDNKINMVCHIEDTGIGIPAEHQNKIFEAFKQQSNQTTRKYDGTGLGLSITKHLMEIQGGSISVKSKPGKGSIFSLHFKNIKIPQKVILPEQELKETKKSHVRDKPLHIPSPQLTKSIRHHFSEKFKQKSETIENSGNMSKIKNLGEEIQAYGNKNNNTFFLNIGNDLSKAAEKIDIEEITDIFARLNDVLLNEK
ncbi:MAG: PAS domain-containing sensor histidine kinase, partial [Bacteroidota bacterium]